MKGRVAALVTYGLLFCASIPAQNRVLESNFPDTCHRPEWQFEAKNRQSDATQCSPAIEEHEFYTQIVSARALAHKPLKTARKEFDQGIKSLRRGRIEQALGHLAEANRLDPDFVDAQTELGLLHVRMGHPEFALTYLDRARILEPNSAVLNNNRAAALVMLNRPEEAEQSARRAVQMESRLVQGHYMLGVPC